MIHVDCGFVTSFYVVYLVKTSNDLISYGNVTKRNSKISL